jgi:hypothetical protein
LLEIFEIKIELGFEEKFTIENLLAQSLKFSPAFIQNHPKENRKVAQIH